MVSTASGKRSGVVKKPKDPDVLETTRIPGLTNEEMFAESTLSSIIRNAAAARTYGGESFTPGPKSDANHCVTIVAKTCGEVRNAELGAVTDMLTAQMFTLDSLFTAMVKRAGENMGQYPEAVDRYMGIAMKAQAGCRTTAETLARIKRGGKQTVKVVHVHEGGQAVVADTVNNSTRTGGGGGGNGENDGQVHGQSQGGPALLGQDEAGYGVPLPGIEGSEALPLARRAEHRSAEG